MTHMIDGSCKGDQQRKRKAVSLRTVEGLASERRTVPSLPETLPETMLRAFEHGVKVV